jgi:hypothetical protein
MARESAAVLGLTCRTPRPWVRSSALTLSPGICPFSSHMLLGSHFWGNPSFQSCLGPIWPRSTARSRHPGFLSPVYRVSENVGGPTPTDMTEARVVLGALQGHLASHYLWDVLELAVLRALDLAVVRSPMEPLAVREAYR